MVSGKGQTNLALYKKSFKKFCRLITHFAASENLKIESRFSEKRRGAHLPEGAEAHIKNARQPQ